MKASEAKKIAAKVRDDRLIAENNRRNTEYENAKRAAKKELPVYLKEVKKEIREAVKEGYSSTSIRLPGDERSNFARNLAWELDLALSKDGYECHYDYYRTRDIEYPDDHWSFSVEW